MCGVWRKIHLAPASERTGIDEMSGVQKTGAQNSFDLQLAHKTEAAFRFRCQESRVHRFETREQRRIREAIDLWPRLARARVKFGPRQNLIE